MKRMLGIIAVSILLFYIFSSTAYYFLQEKVYFLPDKLEADHQFNFKGEWKEVFLDSQHEGRIHGLHFSSGGNNGAILYLHGNAGSLAGWGHVAEDLLPHGYDVFMIDYRGYGKSTGALSEQNLFSDTQEAYDYLKNHYTEDSIIVYGRSIGTGMAVNVSSRNQPQKLILETPFTNLVDLAHSYFPIFFHNILVRYPFNSDQYIVEVSCPVMIIHGTNDEVVPFRFGKELSKNVPKELLTWVTIQNGEHNNLSAFPEFHQAVSGFLKSQK